MKPPKIKILKSPTYRKSYAAIRAIIRNRQSSMEVLEGITYDLEESTAYGDLKTQLVAARKQLSSLWQFSTITITPYVTKCWVKFFHGKKPIGAVCVPKSIRWTDIDLRNAVFVLLLDWTGGRDHAFLIKHAERVVAYYCQEQKVRRKPVPMPDRSTDIKYVWVMKRKAKKQPRFVVPVLKMEVPDGA